MINFLKFKYWCLGFSLIFFGLGTAVFFMRIKDGKPGFQYDIDFVGGTEMLVSFHAPIKIDQFRVRAKEKGWTDLTIQSIGTPGEAGAFREFLVRTTDTTEGLDGKFKKDMLQAIPQNSMEVKGITQVGAEVGRDIQWNALLAIMLSLLIILLYVGIRSQSRFAVGAVAAIAHDMLAVLTCFLLLNEPISLHVLAAVLAILGYSLNDTIVIFSRVRENFKVLKGRPEEEVVNLSINQTLRRTLLTSLSTLLTVLAIFFLGGQALHGFSLAMLIGVVVGTYSSVYIASPVMLAIRAAKSS